jgi:hypothetical protein
MAVEVAAHPEQGVGGGREGDAAPARAATASTQRRQLQSQGSRVRDPMQDPDAARRGSRTSTSAQSVRRFMRSALRTRSRRRPADRRAALPAGEIEQKAAGPGTDHCVGQQRMERVPHPRAPESVLDRSGLDRIPHRRADHLGRRIQGGERFEVVGDVVRLLPRVVPAGRAGQGIRARPGCAAGWRRASRWSGSCARVRRPARAALAPRHPRRGPT